VAFLRLVVDRRAALHRGGEGGAVDRLARGQGVASSSIRLKRKRPSPSAMLRKAMRASPVSARERPSAASARLSSPSSAASSSRCEDEDLAAREQGAVKLEGRVLGGGADQHDGAVLDIGQEGVLLGAVEAVDLVDEEQGALAADAPLLGRVEDLASSATPEKDGRDRLEMQIPSSRRGGGRSSSCRRPGGPHRIIEARRRAAIMRPIGPSGPSR